MKKTQTFFASLIVLVIGTSASAQSSYGSRDSLRSQDVQYGSVMQSGPEAIRQQADGRYTATASAIGGAVGVAVARGQGSGSGAAQAIGGLVGGAVAGVGAELLQRRETEGQNVLVRLDSGRSIFVLMPLVSGRMFAPGERVAVAAVNGSERIISVPALPQTAEVRAAQQGQRMPLADRRPTKEEEQELTLEALVRNRR